MWIMFEITPSDEFSAWFEALSPAAAEEVAGALDLLAEAGVALGPSRTRRALLWYDGCGGSALDLPSWGGRDLASLLDSIDDVRELLLWQREVVRCLESAIFRERLARLEREPAGVALLAISKLQERLKAARSRIQLEQSAWPPRVRALPVLAERASSSEPRRRLEEGEEPSRGLKEAFFDVLRLVGLEPARLMNSPSGLCELTVGSTDPPLRVLFGLDARSQKLVLLLGEPLTRQYYGDSVKLAERRWSDYSASAHTASESETSGR